MHEVLHKQGQRLMYILVEKVNMNQFSILVSNCAIRKNVDYSWIVLNQCFTPSGFYWLSLSLLDDKDDKKGWL